MVTERDMDATHLLMEDHRKVEGLFEQFEKGERRRPQGEDRPPDLHRTEGPRA